MHDKYITMRWCIIVLITKNLEQVVKVYLVMYFVKTRGIFRLSVVFSLENEYHVQYHSLQILTIRCNWKMFVFIIFYCILFLSTISTHLGKFSCFKCTFCTWYEYTPYSFNVHCTIICDTLNLKKNTLCTNSMIFFYGT